MKYIDFIIQTLIILFGIALLITSFGEESWPAKILYAQILLGPWQFIGSFISVLIKADGWNVKKIHLIISSLYLLLLMGVAVTHIMPEKFALAFLIIPAWALGFYYYSISWRLVFIRTKKQSSFLPHINF